MSHLQGTWFEKHSSATYPEMINRTWGKKYFFRSRINKYKSFVMNLKKDREVSIWREHNLLSSSHCSFPELQRSHFEFHHGWDFTKLNYITQLHWLLLKKYDKQITSWESSGRKRLMLLFREMKLKTWERQQGRNLLFCTSPMNAKKKIVQTVHPVPTHWDSEGLFWSSWNAADCSHSCKWREAVHLESNSLIPSSLMVPWVNNSYSVPFYGLHLAYTTHTVDATS